MTESHYIGKMPDALYHIMETSYPHEAEEDTPTNRRALGERPNLLAADPGTPRPPRLQSGNIFMSEHLTSSTFARPPQDIILRTGGQEMIRLEENGDIYVRGNLATNDMEVVDGMRQLLLGNRDNR